jgi:hypothetical protein
MNYIIGNNNKLRGAIDNLQAIGCNDKEFTTSDSNKTTIQNDAVTFTTTTMTVATGVAIVNENYSIESGVAVSVTPGKRYSYDGAAASTWTLGTIASNTGTETWIYNRGSDIITVNSAAAGTDIYYNGAAVSTFAILPSENVVLFGDSDYILVSGIKKPRLFTGATPPTFAETDDIYIAT